MTVLARHDFQMAQAERLGAAHVVSAHGDYIASVAEAAQVRLLSPLIGRPVGTGGGFDYTFVCVGGTGAMEDALRFTRPGGTIVLLGNATTMNRLDWTPLWLKELTVRGSVCYGVHAHGGAGQDAFAEAAALIESGRAPVGPLLSATFPLAEYRRAIDAAMNKNRARSVKVAFRF